MSEIVGIDEIVASVKMELNISNSGRDLTFRKWINEAMVGMGTLATMKTLQAELTVVDGRAELPCGFKQFGLLRTACGDPRFDNWVYADIPFLTSCDCTITDLYADWTRWFNIQDGYIILSSDIDTETLSLVYEGFDVDENGVMNIPDEYERGLTAYCGWKYSRQNFNIYPVNVRQDFRIEWIAQKQYYKGLEQKRQWALDKRRVYLTVFNRLQISPR